MSLSRATSSGATDDETLQHMKKENVRVLAFLVFAVVALVWIVWPYVSEYFFPLTRALEIGERGQFGDSFGSLNALFTGFAFAGVALTLYLQLVDRREREMERLNEKRAKYEADFEGRFFRLNDSLREVVTSMELPNKNGRECTGKDVFAHYVTEVHGVSLSEVIDGRYGGAGIKSLISKYPEVFKARQDDLAPYFRMLYHIIRYVDRADIPNKTDFTDLVRAELSPSELKLLALNCITEHGEKFKGLVERYHLLKHLPDDEGEWLTKKAMLEHFSPDAFMDPDDPRPSPA